MSIVHIWGISVASAAPEEDQGPGRANRNRMETGESAESVAVHERACKALGERLGTKSRDFAACLIDLAPRYKKQGDYQEALALLEQALAIHEKSRPRDDLEVAVCLFEIANLKRRLGNTDVEPLYRRALAIRSKTLGPRHPDVAAVLNNLAVLYTAKQRHDDAFPLYQRALSIRQETLKSDDLDLALSMNNLGNAYARRRDLDEAEPLIRSSLSIYEARLGAGHPRIAFLLGGLARLLQQRGDYEQALSIRERALAIMEETNHPDTAVRLHELAMLRYDMGDFRESVELYERASSLFEAVASRQENLASALSGLALAHEQLGDYARADEIHRRSLDLYETAKGPDSTELATVLNNLAELCRKKGEYGEAEVLHERALRIKEDALGPDHPDTSSSLNNLAILYALQGEHDRAKSLFERTVSIREKAYGPEDPLVANALSNLGWVYEAKNELEEAASLFERVLSIQEKALGHEHPAVASTLNNLAAIHEDRGEHARAIELYEQALVIKRKIYGANHPGFSMSLYNLANLHRKRGDYERARPLLERVLSARVELLGERHPDVAKTLMSLGHLSFATGDRDAAREYYTSSLEIEEANLGRALLIADDARRIFYARELFMSTDVIVSINMRMAPRDAAFADLALTSVLRRKGRIQELAAQTSSMLRRSLPEEDRHLLNDLSIARSRYASLALSGRDTRDADSLEARIVALEHEQEELWARLRGGSHRARALTEPVGIGDIQSRLPADAALVEYVRYHGISRVGMPKKDAQPRYGAYVVFSDRFEWVDLGAADIIDERVEAFRGGIRGRADVIVLGHALYELVVRPIEDRLGPTDRLFIAPDGALNLVPMGALVDDHGNYLVERFRFLYLAAGRDLLRPWAREPVAEGPVVVVANPAGADLPGTEQEASFLSSLFDDVITMQHGEATEARLRAHERPRILHLATHGTFGVGRRNHTIFEASTNETLRSSGATFGDGSHVQLDNPMLYSWLDLATPGAPSAEVADLDDGKLTAFEVSGWDLRGTELVTLSACDTGLGEYHPGEGVLGFRRAFAVAGAQTQVMSLWKVSDNTTAMLMREYYRRLVAGEGRSEAMRSTQLEFLRHPETHHPHDWASFLVVGEWAPLASTHPEGPPPITRPRGCQAALGVPSAPGPVALVIIGLLALSRRRRRMCSFGPNVPSLGTR